VPPLAPPCRLAQLQVSGGDPRLGVFFNSATGSLVGGITVRNHGAPCSLTGRPHVRLVGGGAAAVAQAQTVFRAQARAPDLLPPSFWVRALPHGARWGLTIWWLNWCAPGNPGGGNLSPAPTGLKLTLPHGGGSVRLKVTHAPRCDAPSLPSALAVGSFQPLVPQPPVSTRLPLRLQFDHLWYRAAAGTTLHYQVTVTSTARRPFRFRSCPVYFEQLVASSHHELHYLNCRPAGTGSAGSPRLV
jgi:hypothetical protein